MKFILTLATLAIAATALDIESEASTEVLAQVATEATGAAYNGPIVPENYGAAVHDFNMESPFTDQECYQKQVDIYSDQIIAIEALRLEVLQLTQRITQAEYDYQNNAQKISENKSKIISNANEALKNKGKIEVLYEDVNDVADCLSRQWSEQKNLRSVLELYCHQFTYVAHLPHQCESILGSGSHLHQAYAWPGSEDGHGDNLY